MLEKVASIFIKLFQFDINCPNLKLDTFPYTKSTQRKLRNPLEDLVSNLRKQTRNSK